MGNSLGVLRNTLGVTPFLYERNKEALPVKQRNAVGEAKKRNTYFLLICFRFLSEGIPLKKPNFSVLHMSGNHRNFAPTKLLVIKKNR